MQMLYNLVRLARPSHWIKNGFVFAALVFSRKVTDPAAILAAVEGFVAFCLASSAIYALNDVLDRKEDAQHPVKCRRPVASRSLSPTAAVVFAAVLGLAAVAAALLVGLRTEAAAVQRGFFVGTATVDLAFTFVLGAYFLMMLAYVFGLKRVAILDVLVLAVGFVIRAYAGGVAIDVWVSPWLIMCTLTLALFLGFAKRESERAALGAQANHTRPLEWAAYDEKSLDHMMTVTAALAVVTYMLYTVSPETISRVGHPWMFVTVLPVVYGVFRFYRMAITGRATDPVDMVQRDPAFVVALAVWVAMVAVLLFAWPKGAAPLP